MSNFRQAQDITWTSRHTGYDKHPVLKSVYNQNGRCLMHIPGFILHNLSMHIIPTKNTPLNWELGTIEEKIWEWISLTVFEGNSFSLFTIITMVVSTSAYFLFAHSS